jgi:hypothetical protein
MPRRGVSSLSLRESPRVQKTEDLKQSLDEPHAHCGPFSRLASSEYARRSTLPSATGPCRRDDALSILKLKASFEQQFNLLT